MSDPIIITQEFNAPIDKVWKALTDRTEMKTWYFDIPDFVLSEGAVFKFYEPGETKQFLHLCKIIKIIPGELFQHTWTYPDLSKGVSTVTWKLMSLGDRTELILTHEGLENFSDGGAAFARDNYVAGWNEIVCILLHKHFEENSNE